jgi:thioredoxin 1
MGDKYAEKAKFCKVNTSENRRLAIGQKVLGLPTVAYYMNGEKIGEVSGEVTTETIEAELKKHVS